MDVKSYYFYLLVQIVEFTDYETMNEQKSLRENLPFTLLNQTQID